MTPHERAEKICPLDESKPLPVRGRDELRELIAAQISEAEREARESVLNEQKCKDCGCSYERCCCNPVREADRFTEGFNAAREKAMEICDGDILDKPDDLSPMLKHTVFEYIGKVAERIRNMTISPDSE